MPLNKTLHQKRRIGFVVFDGELFMDVIGPLEVFSVATACLAGQGRANAGYEVELIAPKAGPVTSSSGLTLYAERSFSDTDLGRYDTLIVGGSGNMTVIEDTARVLRRWFTDADGKVRRIVSTCTGTFFLAEAGLLNGRRAVTHWRECDRLAALYPQVIVDRDPVFIKDGAVYTSAGVTAGLDLALALVEEDFGRKISLAVARLFVMFLKRPGGQSQFSALLNAQMVETDPISQVQQWLLANLDQNLTIETLAERAAMSPRNFARVFTRATGSTPAEFVIRARVEAVKRCLEDSNDSLLLISERCGFGSTETLRRNFQRYVGVSPLDYRARFR